MRSHPRARARALVLVLSAWATLGIGAAAQVQTPELQELLPGFKPNGVYEMSGIDNVDLFSGDSGIRVPIGPTYTLGPGTQWQLQASYSIKSWRPSSCVSGLQTGFSTTTTGAPTLGFGWTLQLGYIDRYWASFVTADGGRHDFNSALTQDVTRDGSRLRISGWAGLGGPPATLGSATAYTVEFPDGSVHAFDQYHLRPGVAPGSAPSVDFNDQRPGAPPSVRFGLRRMLDPFGREVLRVDYDPSQPWQFTRVTLYPAGVAPQQVNFTWTTLPVQDTDGTLFVWPVLQRVDFPLDGGLQTVAFAFDPGVFARADWTTIAPCTTRPNVAVPLLREVSVTGVSLAAGAYRYGFQYLLGLPASQIYANGLLQWLTLPTGGRIGYSYGETISCPEGQTQGCEGTGLFAAPLAAEGAAGEGSARDTRRASRARLAERGGYPTSPRFWDPELDFFVYEDTLDGSAAVVTRLEQDPFGGPQRETRYRRWHKRYGSLISGTARYFRFVVVTAPDGNGARVSRRHVFATAYDGPQPLELERWQYAGEYPFASAPARATVRCYEGDLPLPGTTGTLACGYRTGTNTPVSYNFYDNVREQKEVVWYGQNPILGADCSEAATPCKQTLRFGWFQFAGEYGQERLTTNAALGTAGRHTATIYLTDHQPASWEPWLLKRVGSSIVSTIGCTEQPCLVTTEYGYSATLPAFRELRRVSDATWGTLTTTFTPDAYGLPAGQTTTGAGIGFENDSCTFSSTHTFAGGQLTSKTWAGMDWPAYSVTREPAAGLVKQSRAPFPISNPASALTTNYVYDGLGRLTRIAPPGELLTTICHVDSSPSGPYALVRHGGTLANRCTTDLGPLADGSGAVDAYQYDGFGRLRRHVRRLPNTVGASTFAFQETRYNDVGQKAFESEWTPCLSASNDPLQCFGAVAQQGTTWGSFDPFGRARAVTLADGNRSLLSFDDPAGIPHSDTFQETRRSKPGDPDTRVLVSALWRDVLGRVVRVAEAGESAWGPSTYYDYDTLDNLATVRTDSPTSPTQTRRFTHDAFGFVRSEQVPEKTGLVQYLRYDARGNVAYKSEPLTAGNTVWTTTTRDAAGRLVDVLAGGSAGSALYAHHAYDGNESSDGPNSRAKLTRRSGWNPGALVSDAVTDTFTYGGLGGRLSAQRTVIAGSAPLDVTQTWTYDALGREVSHAHPRAAGQSAFDVASSYRSDALVGVSVNGAPVVGSAGYNAAGGLASYSLPVVQATIEPDPTSMPRPRRIFTTGAEFNFDSGVYQYGLLGNVTAIGADVFTYDARSRLTYAALSGLSDQTYTYDRFGNLLSQGSGLTYSVDPNTNRVTEIVWGFPLGPVEYDYRGQLRSYGGEHMGWDGLGRQSRHWNQFGEWRYLLDAEGERVTRLSVVGGVQVDAWHTLRDAGRRVVTEFVLNGTPESDHVRLGDLLVASYSPGNKVPWAYFVSDHLGTPRLRVNANGKTHAYKYWPFGQDTGGNATYPIAFGLAGMERDAFTNQYRDHARAHDFFIGRFTSPDPAPGRIDDPHSWNRYIYAADNPLRNVDPDGRAEKPKLPGPALHGVSEGATAGEMHTVTRGVVPGRTHWVTVAVPDPGPDESASRGERTLNWIDKALLKTIEAPMDLLLKGAGLNHEPITLGQAAGTTSFFGRPLLSLLKPTSTLGILAGRLAFALATTALKELPTGVHEDLTDEPQATLDPPVSEPCPDVAACRARAEYERRVRQ